MRATRHVPGHRHRGGRRYRPRHSWGREGRHDNAHDREDREQQVECAPELHSPNLAWRAEREKVAAFTRSPGLIRQGGRPGTQTMSIYGTWLLPRLIDWTMRSADLTPYRERLIPLARGCVLEIGIGSGLNLPLYRGAVERVIGLDPSFELLRRAGSMISRAMCPVHLVRAAAEAIPLVDGSMDTVVMTWTLCSLTDACTGLAEMRRVLKPGGELLFVEHGLAPEPQVAAWQHRLDPLWTRISCHLDNPVGQLLREAGFELVTLNSGYLGRGPKPMTFMYEGLARSTA
jgi:SAM-dependent methyltransferase